MSTTRALLAGAALAGSLLAGVAVAPAAMASASTATATQQAQTSSKNFFGPYYSGFGQGEDFGHRSYYKGYWTKESGRYWFYGDLFDRDRDRSYSYVWFKWHDRFGSHTKVFKTRGHSDIDRFGGFKGSSGFDDFKIRVCEGTDKFDDCGRWGDAF
ncbi:hypothetical protein OG884_17620 [Streptosporangium sp. NBC_01755]|uniref:hypothetical protein n=1 Tax=unclassified Streptosporangium TaxID=2632669 RepID=UPI002DD890AC|nr:MULTISPECIES: hypothetical protein [unclassified Streptosporangium]WSA25040.1 hypothetical protein OIE13_29545 [Streptosporangium sp. NBC_01810]WSD03629.1 hypothetical protein OG884_17620 [Streptosporangium sp. NBC_01755]